MVLIIQEDQKGRLQRSYMGVNKKWISNREKEMWSEGQAWEIDAMLYHDWWMILHPKF